jgi:hypothetical protein
MATFYIKDGNDVFELSATTDVTITYTGAPTRFKVEDGSTVSDHYVVDNATCSFDGVITDIVSLNNPDTVKTSKEYIEGLRRIQLAKRTFTVFADNKLQPFDDCVFTQIGIVKSAMEGLSGWRVSLAFEQIRIAERAEASVVNVNDVQSGDKDLLSGKTDTGTQTTENKDIKKENSFFNGGYKAFVGKTNDVVDGVAGAG